jgi:RNA polymerase subunit RPABC4/transcription elongation factor Spt4
MESDCPVAGEPQFLTKWKETAIATHEITENKKVQAKRNGTTAIVLAKT